MALDVELAFAGLLLVAGVAGLVFAARRPPASFASNDRRRLIGLGLFLAAWLAGVLFMTLRPGAGSGRLLNLVPLRFEGPASVIDAVLNVGVFVPLGLLLAAAAIRLPVTFLIGLLLTLGIETTQYLTQVGRTADINDVLTNTTGTVLGWAAGAAVVQITRRRLREP
jgi:glycopeptide antibiotics resistance protein